MQPTRTCTLLLVLVCALGGCKALLYTPNAHVVPLFEDGGQVQVGAAITSDSGLDVQVAASPARHVLVFGSTAQIVGTRYRQRYGELGGGFYVGLPYRLRLEGLAGVGWGRVNGEGQRELASGVSSLGFGTEPYSYDAAYRRSFGQVNLGLQTDGGALLVGGALRLARVQYDDFETEPVGLVDEVRGVYVEPALLFRTRLNRYTDLEGLIGISYRASGENWELFSRRERYGSVGVRFHLGRQ